MNTSYGYCLETKFTQCKLQQDNSFTYGFIPAWAAKVGNRVELVEFGGFWKVITAGEPLEWYRVGIPCPWSHSSNIFGGDWL